MGGREGWGEGGARAKREGGLEGWRALCDSVKNIDFTDVGNFEVDTFATDVFTIRKSFQRS